jgi:very-short-patch-repair endonuclease
MRASRPTPVGHLVAAVARRQHGLITRARLIELGLGPHAIGNWVRAGHLHRVHRGVYAVGHAGLTMHGRFLAAVLAHGDEAALSHRTAAVLWRLLPMRGPRIDVTVPRGGQRRRRRLIVLHRSVLSPEEVGSVEAVPVTCPRRTIVDLADFCSPRELERVLDEAAYLRLDLAGLQPIRGRRGSGRLARVLADHDFGSTRTMNDFEEALFALCRRHRLPPPLVNQRVGRFKPDFVWRPQRLIVETDGWQAHGTRTAFERDRVRDAALTASGWRVVRITWRRLRREPAAVAAQLSRLLACA